MNEAHEKTRIRQLEDAAAHWEHKYGNARQYNRNLEERIAQLKTDLAASNKLRDQWCKEYTEQRDDAQALVKRCATLELRLSLEGLGKKREGFA